MITSIFTNTKSYIVCFFLVGMIIFHITGCSSTVSDQRPNQDETIQLSEIKQWGKWYENIFPSAPKLLTNKAEKTFYKNQFYVRVPLAGSSGMIYFGKRQSLESVFIHTNRDNRIISYPFSSNYEFIDPNKFTYRRTNLFRRINRIEPVIN